MDLCRGRACFEGKKRLGIMNILRDSCVNLQLRLLNLSRLSTRSAVNVPSTLRSSNLRSRPAAPSAACRLHAASPGASVPPPKARHATKPKRHGMCSVQCPPRNTSVICQFQSEVFPDAKRIGPGMGRVKPRHVAARPVDHVAAFTTGPHTR